MKRMIWSIALVSLLSARFTSAASITHVTVTIGSNVWSDATVGWSLPLVLNPGESVVFTQMGVFNFDTSDVEGHDKDPGTVPTIAITVDGVTTVFHDLNGVLNVRGLDRENNEDSEAQEFGAWMDGPGYRVRVGYPDNVHTGACGEWAANVGLVGAFTCLPDGFLDATYFYGAGARYPVDLPYSGYPHHCNEHGFCFDAGAIEVQDTTRDTRTPDPVPEPGALCLFGTGLFGLVALIKRRG